MPLWQFNFLNFSRNKFIKSECNHHLKCCFVHQLALSSIKKKGNASYKEYFKFEAILTLMNRVFSIQ